MIFLLYFALAALICLIVGLILYARWNYGVLESLNIPVVKRSFFMGSTPDLHLKVQHYEDIERFKKYGPVYGVYEGRNPQIHVCDAELAKLILVKDYEYFHNRREIDLGDPIVNQLPDFLRDDKWKIIRNAQTPFFTMSKMRSMKHTLKECADEFCNTLQDESQYTDQLNISSLFDGCVMDVFARCGFGIKLGDSSASEQRQSFVKLFKELMGQNEEFGLLYTLSMSFPFLVKFSPTLNGDASTKIAAILKSIIDSRKKGPKQSDFIEVLSDMYDKLSTPEYKNSGITESTIMAQGIGLVLAGYDAMTTGLSVLAYYLSKYPEVQEKLFQEIDNFVEEHNGEIAFEKMNELPYLHACFTEAYRLVPPFIRPERECTKDWEHNGIKIKKGMSVMVPAWAIHRNPDIFPDPDAFNPDRFLSDNKTQTDPYNFLSFGHGPRNCIGKRFAYEISKYIMCNVLRQFRIEGLERTRLNFKKGVLFLVMYDPIYVNLSKR